jgi:hypothetical protein
LKRVGELGHQLGQGSQTAVDPGLAEIIKVWPRLPEVVRKAMLGLAGAFSGQAGLEGLTEGVSRGVRPGFPKG